MSYSTPRKGLGLVQSVRTEARNVSVPVALPANGIIDPRVLAECSTFYATQGTTYPDCTVDAALVERYGDVVTTDPLKWSEAGYTAARGEQSRMFFLEDLSRRNMAVWFSRDGIETASYDLSSGSGVMADDYTMSRCAAALRNFNGIFQVARWRNNPRGSRLVGSSGGSPQEIFIEAWDEYSNPDQTAMEDALKRVFRRAPSVAERASLISGVKELFKRVPRYTGPCCGPEAYFSGRPLWDWVSQPMPAAARYFWRLSNGKLEPSSWTSSMLNLLAPAIAEKRSTASFVRVGQSRPPIVVPAGASSSWGVSGTGGWLFIGVAVAVSAGLVWWAFR